MAGLSAARELKSQGLSVLVLEASHQHGGRVRSHTLGSTRVELGAEEHYLNYNNPVYPAMTNAFGESIYVPSFAGDSLTAMGDGRFCNETQGDCAEDTDFQNYQSYWDAYWRQDQQTDFSLTMADDIQRRYGVDTNHRAYQLFENGLAGSVYSTSLDKIGVASLAKDGADWSLSEEVLSLAPSSLGYLDALNQIWWNDLLDLVKLNRAVTNIDYSGEFLQVEDSTGELYSARKVIVTASVGVLQSEIIKFFPSLPGKSVQAYNGIGIGKGMKVALRFREPFWQDNLGCMVTDGVSGSFWVPSNYKSDSPDHILMCYPMGNQAEALAAKGPKTEAEQFVIQAMLAELDRLYSGAASHQFIDGIARNFMADPYIQGTYSFPKLQTHTEDGTSLRRHLREPIADCLFFAGEATSDNAWATVPGAILEGQRAAKEVAQSINA